MMREQVSGPVADQASEGEAEECADKGTCIPSRGQEKVDAIYGQDG